MSLMLSLFGADPCLGLCKLQRYPRPTPHMGLDSGHFHEGHEWEEVAV